MDDNKEKEIKEENVKATKHTASATLSICGIVAALAAWVVYFAHGLTAMIIGVVGLILSVLGAVRIGKGCLRDLSITAAIASGVLIIVFVIFYWVLPGVF